MKRGLTRSANVAQRQSSGCKPVAGGSNPSVGFGAVINEYGFERAKK